MYATFMWNWSKFALCDNVIFIASCINHALEDEIQQSTSKEKVTLGAHLRKILRCIGFSNGILIEICQHWQNEAHHIWFNGQKIYICNEQHGYSSTQTLIILAITKMQTSCNDMPPNSSKDQKVGPITKQWKKKRVGARSLTCNTPRVGGHARAPGWD